MVEPYNQMQSTSYVSDCDDRLEDQVAKGMGLGVSGDNDEGSFSASISSEMSKGVTNGSRFVRMDEMIEMPLKKVMFKTLK